jgi:hypothetical protein
MTWVGEGRATHMGKYAEVGAHNFTAPDAQGAGLVLNGVFHSTAANGATIAGTYSGTYQFLPDNLVRFDVTAIYLRGTGRLTGVTGQGQVVALLDTTTGEFHFDTVGFWTKP